MASGSLLSSKELAQLIIDALLHAELIEENCVEEAIEIAEEEIEARKAVGDY
jgi:hypothetical protein